MARRSVLVKKKTKVKRASNSEQYIINLKYLGDEPILKYNYTNSEYTKALNWYNSMCDVSDAKEYIKNYLKKSGRILDVKKFNRVPDNSIPLTAGWIARIIENGTDVADKSKKFLEEKIENCLQKAVVEVDKPKVENKPSISVQDRVKAKADEILGEVENIVDNRREIGEFSFYDYLKSKEIPAVYAGMISEQYVHWLQELLEAVDGSDEQLKEAYSNVPKKKMQFDIKFFSGMIEDCERYRDTTKKIRKPRKPKSVSIEKKLKNFKYQKEDRNFKIASIAPEKVIGAQELWTFNTKYKIVTVFRAIDRGGLQIKGTTIINFDENNSYSKGCGRKPEEILKKIQTNGKIVLRKMIEEMKTDKKLQTRINENTILLKIT